MKGVLSQYYDLTAQGDGRVVAGKSSGVKGDDGCWIMDVSRLLLDPHTYTGKLFLRGSGLENPRGNPQRKVCQGLDRAFSIALQLFG